MANRIMLNQTSYHGAGAIEEIANEAKAHAFRKAFVCSDPDLIKFGVTAKVTDILDREGLAYEIYSDIKANPTIENVKNGVAYAIARMHGDKEKYLKENTYDASYVKAVRRKYGL